MLFRRLSFLAAVVSCFLSASAQTPTVPRLSETMDVSIVNVEVFVTDASGARVHGVTKEQFELFENGVLQPITNFAEYAEVSAPEPSAQRARKRTMIVFVDRFQLSKERSDSFFAAVKDLFQKTIRRGDSAMIASWYLGTLKTRQAFTDDLTALEGTIDEIARESCGPVADDYRRAKDDAEMIRDFEQQVETFIAQTQDLSNAPPRTEQSRQLQPSWAASMEARGRAKRAHFEQRRKIETLRALTRSVAADEGKKLLLLATHRLSSVPGAEYFYAGTASPLAVIENRNEFSAAADLRSLYETANANGVTIYAMYPEGHSDLPSVDGDDRFGPRTAEPAAGDVSQTQIQFLIADNEMAALTEIARHTGGVSASGPEAARLLPHVADDLQSYYSLAYRARGGRPDTPRNIVVKAKNRDLVIRSRQQYVEKSDVTRMEDRVIAALFRKPEGAHFSVGVALEPAKWRGKNTVVIPITLRIPISALTTLPEKGDYAGAFSVYLAWGTKFQKLSSTSRDSRPFRIPAGDLARARRGSYTYSVDVVGDAQTERIALAVLDEISKEYALGVITFRLLPPAPQ